ncbi:MAG: hypothetical protein LBF86_03375 [Helicobacteraceae bacterium]|nr:hypothetical protein [Helicobacteraceae bacterium]
MKRWMRLAFGAQVIRDLLDRQNAIRYRKGDLQSSDATFEREGAIA